MRLSGKDVCSQTQRVVLFRTKIDEQITERLLRSVFICFDSERGLFRVHLSRQGSKLTAVSRILEQDQVVRIQTYSTNVFVFVEHVLHEKYDAYVSVMRPFREQVCDRFVGFLHQVVDKQQNVLTAVEIVDFR